MSPPVSIDIMDGAELAEFRCSRNMDQPQLAAMLNEKLGRRYDRNRISRWENGAERIPQIVANLLRGSVP
jgi:chromosome partitioning protein